MRKKLKVLLLFDSPYFAPRRHSFIKEFDNDPDWGGEHTVYEALRENGHHINLLGLHNNIDILIEEIREDRPDVVFNLTEVFNEKSHMDKNVVGLLEMLGVPYTGVSSAGLFLCNNKALSKKILTYHKIKTPRFITIHRNTSIRIPDSINFPLIIKPLDEEASRGISRASFVNNKNSFLNRVKFIHNKIRTDAIAEEYVNGREMYVTVIGNKNLEVIPPREVTFGKALPKSSRISTYKTKWDNKYRKKWNIKYSFPKLRNGLMKKIESICKEAYRALHIQGICRFDIRITPDSFIYILEANANPCLEKGEAAALSARKAGICYNSLIQRLLKLALEKNK